MKVLLANKYFHRNGGSEAVFFDERAYLISQGVTVVDFSMADSRNDDSEYSSFFVENKSYRSSNHHSVLTSLINGLGIIHSTEAVSNLQRLIVQSTPDILHCHNIYHQLTPSIIGIAKKHNIPVVLTLHDYKPICPTYLRLKHGSVCSDCIDGDFFNVIKNRCADGSIGKSAILYAEAVIQKILGNYEKIDVVIAPSQFMADSVSGHRFLKERVHTIHNGINVDQITRSKTDHGYVLYIGRLSEEKGIRRLLEAHKNATNRFPLKICGTGPLFEELKLNYPGADFIGYKSGDALQKIISEASVVAVPSEWYENCPMSILEAMAYGKPVVASRIGGIPELVFHGETGFLFEPGNADELLQHVATLMKHRELRESFSRAARQRVEREFSLQQHNDKLLAVYNSIIFET